MANLFQITQLQQALINKIELLDGEITPQIEELLVINQSELEQKSMAYLEVINKKDSFNKVIDIEIKRLQALKKRNTNILDTLKNNLLTAVKTFGTYQIGTQKFGTRKSQSIEILISPNDLNEKYQTKKLTITANKSELKKAIVNGKVIDGVKLKDNLKLKIN